MPRLIPPASVSGAVSDVLRELEEDPDQMTGAAEELRNDLLTNIEAIDDRSDAAGRSMLLATEQRARDAYEAGVRKLDEALKPVHALQRSALSRRREEVRERRDRADRLAPPEPRRGGPRYSDDASIHGRQVSAAMHPGAARDAALHMIEARSADLDDTAARRLADELREIGGSHNDASGAELVLAIGDDAYLRAFGKLARDPLRGHMGFDDEERAAFSRAQDVARSINIGTPANGGLLMPLTLDPAVMLTSDGVIDPLRRIARVETTTTDHWKGITSAGVTAEYSAEGTEISDASPNDIAQPTVDVHRASCGVEVTLEAAMDTTFVSQLGELFTDAKSTLEAQKFWAGTGTGEPEGVITGLAGTSSEVAPNTAETFVVGDVYKLLEAVPARFRSRAKCSFVGDLAVYNLIREFGEGSDGSDIWAPSLSDDTPDRLLGRRAFEASESDDGFDPAVTADNFLLTCGSFRDAFVIADRLGSMMTVQDALGTANNRPTGTRWYTLWFRNGSKVVNTAALRVLNIATAV